MKEEMQFRMMEDIIDRLTSFGLPARDLFSKYVEPWRYYHGPAHIVKMLNDAGWVSKNTAIYVDDLLFLAVFFHDIVYEPGLVNAEDLSAKEFLKYTDILYGEGFTAEDVRAVVEAIDFTDYSKNEKDVSFSSPASHDMAVKLRDLDLGILYGPFEDFQEYEKGIFKEFQACDYSAYLPQRIALLKKFKVSEDRISWVKNRKVNIAVFPGSFDPFHVGHKDILEKAESLFDKVIVAQGVNKLKNKTLPKTNIHEVSVLAYRQVETYTDTLIDFLKSLRYPVTVVRGLRNAADAESELRQLRYLEDMAACGGYDLRVLFIPGSKGFDHVSSSGIRSLEGTFCSDLYRIF